MTKVINFWAGPGTGKSTIASALFSEMKWRGYKVELVREFAKELVYQECYSLLNDQGFVLSEQYNRQNILRDKVDYIITDSPLLLSLIYNKDCDLTSMLTCTQMFNSFDNINFFLTRDSNKEYMEYGRTQTFDEAKVIDKEIKDLLDVMMVDYIQLQSSRQVVNDVCELLEGY